MGKDNEDTPKLGRSMHFHSFALVGLLTMGEWNEFLADATDAIGMTPNGNPARWTYPNADGEGGNGSTIVQPITESFLAIDTWPDHRGAYFIVCSCRRFETPELRKLIAAWELKIVGEAGNVLRIPG